MDKNNSRFANEDELKKEIDYVRALLEVATDKYERDELIEELEELTELLNN